MNFSTFVNNLVETFQALGFTHDLHSTIYVQFATNKLPHFQRLQWTQHAVSKNIAQPNLIDFNEWLREFAIACENLPADLHPANSSNISTTYDNRPKQPTRKQKSSCPFDNQEHHPAHCSLYKQSTAEGRRKLIIDHKRCLNCLGHHMVKDCNSKNTCRDCNKKHHTTIHECYSSTGQQSQATSSRTFENSQRPLQSVKSTNQQSAFHPGEPTSSSPVRIRNSLLFTIPVTLQHQNKFVSTYAFLDSGSSCSYISEKLARNLDVVTKSPSVQLLVGGFHGSKTLTVEPVSFILHPFGQNAEKFQIDNAFVLPKINLHNADPTQLNSICQSYSHLKEISFPDLSDNQIGLILGQDNFDLITAKAVFKGPDNAPRAVLTDIGWTIGGPNDTSFEQSSFQAPVYHSDQQDKDLYDLLASFWRMDTYGTSPEITMSHDEKHAFQTLKATTRYVDGRYEVGLLWKPDAELPNNFNSAILQFKRMQKRLNSQPEVKQLFSDTVSNDLANGYIRKLNPEEIPSTGWLLPEHGVMHPHKPGKLRRVSNARSKYRGVCLNDMLLPGPDLLANLLGVLIRFRERKYPLTADIEAMFMQVSVRPADRKFLRFLWGTEDADFYEYLRFIFGAACSPTCANYALQQCADDNADDFPNIAAIIKQNFYMDDLFVSTDSVNEAVSMYQSLRCVLSKGGFNLTKWTSTSQDVLHSIPDDHRGISPDDIETRQVQQRVLGVIWDLSTDQLRFDPVKLKELTTINLTQRNLLHIISSIFDPLGIAAPITIRLRIIQQLLWRKGVKWDDILTSDILPELFDLISEIPSFSKTIAIPRHAFLGQASEITLHIFCDASYSAIAAVAYFVYHSSASQFPKPSFILGKARVAPLKQHTITKLELQAALIGSRLCKFIKNEHTLFIADTVLWTDSTTVLQWIRGSEKRQQIFVANRVAEILDNTHVRQWRHCPGELNPADDGTRGLPLKDFSSACRWFSGPQFLQQPEHRWPVDHSFSEIEEVTMQSAHSCSPLEPILDFETFSDWTKLVRVTATVLRAVRIFKSFQASVDHNETVIDSSNSGTSHAIKQHVWLDSSANSMLQGSSQPDIAQGCVQPQDISNAKLYLLRQSQRDSFHHEMLALTSKRPVEKCSRLTQLSPFFSSDDFIRAGGRLQKSDFDYCQKHPIILDGKHPVVKLFIRHIHVTNSHSPQQHTKAMLQNEFWILSISNEIRKMLNRCRDCCRQHAAAEFPQMSPLPEFRFPAEKPFPFQQTGLDLFGPFASKSSSTYNKRYALILTCLTTRAVHLEMCVDLSSDATMNALQRFFSRRGYPAQLVSDRGTNFIAAEKELQKIFESTQVHDFLANLEIQWHFNPAQAPHFGGVWERLIRSCKDAFYSILGCQALTDDTFTTLLCEVESFLNCRPLTSVSPDVRDIEALTPNHFLLGRAHGKIPLTFYHDKSTPLTRQWKFAQQLADHVWKRLQKEYYPTLLPRKKWTAKTIDLKPGTLVWILKQFTPRGLWPLGRVIKALSHDSTQFKRYLVKTRLGEKEYPAVQLAPLNFVNQDGTEN